MQTSIYITPIEFQPFSSKHFMDLGNLHFTFFHLLCYLAMWDEFVVETDHLGPSLHD